MIVKAEYYMDLVSEKWKARKEKNRQNACW